MSTTYSTCFIFKLPGHLVREFFNLVLAEFPYASTASYRHVGSEWNHVHVDMIATIKESEEYKSAASFLGRAAIVYQGVSLADHEKLVAIYDKVIEGVPELEKVLYADSSRKV